MIEYKSGYKYQLAGEYSITIPFLVNNFSATFFEACDQTLHIRSGYAWDGPSGPTFDTGNFMRGSLIHDVGYQMMAEKLVSRGTRKDWDEWLRVICLEDGMTRMRAWWVYRAVRLAGGRYGRAPRQVHEAP